MSLIPLSAMWVLIGIGWIVKLLIDRQRYAKQADGSCLVQKIPTVGKVSFELVPTEEIGGQLSVRYPRKGDIGKWPIHRLDRVAKVPVAYPIGKPHFVQTTIDLVMFLGDDVEPLSNLSEIPIVSAQQFGSFTQGITMAVDEALRNVRAESTGEKLKKGSGLLWVYIGMGVLGALVITGYFIGADKGLLESIAKGVNDLLSAKGIQ